MDNVIELFHSKIKVKAIKYEDFTGIENVLYKSIIIYSNFIHYKINNFVVFLEHVFLRNF